MLGATNSGKSSFLNSLLFKSKLHMKKKPDAPNHGKLMYRQKYDVLTESEAPGTTLEMVTVEQFNIGFRVIDTPGIPNLNQCSAHIEDF